MKKEIKQVYAAYKDSVERQLSACVGSKLTISADRNHVAIEGQIAPNTTDVSKAIGIVAAFKITTEMIFTGLSQFLNDGEDIIIHINVTQEKVLVTSNLDDEDNDKKLRRILMDNELSMLYKHEDKQFVLECLQAKYNATHSSGIQWAIGYITNQ